MPLTDKVTVSGTDYYKYQDPAVWTFDSIAAMRAFMGPRQSGASTLGLALAYIASWSGDTPTVMLYAWNDSSTTPDNGTTVIQPTNPSSASGRWIFVALLSGGLE